MRGTLSILHLETCKGVLPALSPEHSPTHPLLVFSHVAGAQGHTHSPEVPGPDHSSGDVYRAGPGPGVGKASYCWADIQAGAPRARRSSQARLRIHRDIVLKMDKGCVPGNRHSTGAHWAVPFPGFLQGKSALSTPQGSKLSVWNLRGAQVSAEGCSAPTVSARASLVPVFRRHRGSLRPQPWLSFWGIGKEGSRPSQAMSSCSLAWVA